MCTSPVSHFIPLSGVMTAKHERLICKSNSWLCPTLTGSSSSNTDFAFLSGIQEHAGLCLFLPSSTNCISSRSYSCVKKGKALRFLLKIIKTRSLLYWPTSGLDNVLCLISNHLECLATQNNLPPQCRSFLRSNSTLTHHKSLQRH